jgi:hypothetical protein
LLDAGLLLGERIGAAVERRQRADRAQCELVIRLGERERLHAGEIDGPAIRSDRRAVVGELAFHLVVETADQVRGQAVGDVVLAPDRVRRQRQLRRRSVRAGARLAEPAFGETGKAVRGGCVVADRSGARRWTADVAESPGGGGIGAAPQRARPQLVGGVLDLGDRRRLGRVVAVESGRKRSVGALLVAALLRQQQRLGEPFDALAEAVATARVARRDLRRRGDRHAERQRDEHGAAQPRRAARTAVLRHSLRPRRRVDPPRHSLPPDACEAETKPMPGGEARVFAPRSANFGRRRGDGH